jgi:hypothetical protein
MKRQAHHLHWGMRRVGHVTEELASASRLLVDRSRSERRSNQQVTIEHLLFKTEPAARRLVHQVA